MRYDYFRRWAHKDGNTPAEYEDSYFIPPAHPVSFPLRFGVFDGATEGFMSRLFAAMLAERFGTFTPDYAADDPLEPLWSGAGEDWSRFADDVRRARTENGHPLTAVDEIGLMKGAAAAFCGLFLMPYGGRGGGAWSACAVGDCCLFHRRDDQVLSFPLRRSSDFTSTPALIASNPDQNRRLSGVVRSISGTYEPGDRFYLMSDALACWFMEELERGRTPWTEIDPLGDQPSGVFRAFISDLRDTSRLRNDDVTLIDLAVLP